MPGQGRVVERPLRLGGARRPRRRPPRTRRDHLRHPSQRPRLLAQRPRRRLELQARRLPGAQEVALLPRAGRTGAGAVGVGGRALRGDGAAGGGVAGAGGVVRVESRLQVPKMREVHRRLIPFRKGCEVESRSTVSSGASAVTTSRSAASVSPSRPNAPVAGGLCAGDDDLLALLNEDAELVEKSGDRSGSACCARRLDASVRVLA